MEVNNNKNVPAVSRGLDVLELLAELSLKSIAERLSTPIPSLWCILMVLWDSGYLFFDRDRETYGFGFKFLYPGTIFMSRMGLRSHAKGYVKPWGDQSI